jgi:hypothetical protein
MAQRESSDWVEVDNRLGFEALKLDRLDLIGIFTSLGTRITQWFGPGGDMTSSA